MSKKIMLVEDDTNLREIYGARLMAEGYEIVSAQDGEAALAMAVKEKPDLIISDVMMPKISGFDMLDILRSTPETKDTKVVMMTALSQAEDKTRADELGADKYLVKSQVTLEDVARVVHELLNDEPAMTVPGEEPATEASPQVEEPAQAEQAPEQPVPDSSSMEQTDNIPVEDQDDTALPPIVPDPQPVPSSPVSPTSTAISVQEEPSDDQQIADNPTDQPVQASPVSATSISVQDDSSTDHDTDDALQQTQATASTPSDTNLVDSLAAADTQTQATPSSEKRAEVGDQIAQAIQNDLSTAPHEVPVQTEPAEAHEETHQEPATTEEQAPAGSRKVIEPITTEQRHVTELAAEEEAREQQQNGGTVVEPQIAPEPQIPQGPAQPDKYTLPTQEEEPEETDPNAIAL